MPTRLANAHVTAELCFSTDVGIKEKKTELTCDDDEDPLNPYRLCDKTAGNRPYGRSF